MTDATEAIKRTRGRSPGYPAIGLRAAIDRARRLYDAERRNAAPVDSILQHWGHKPKSGSGMVAIAAMKKFGLLADEGSGDNRRARLTDLALRILLLDNVEHREERQALIRQAALKPAIHAELWSRYQDEGLPSDRTLRYVLIREQGFTESAVKEFIPQFRSTLAFAGLTEGATLSGHETVEEDLDKSTAPDMDEELVNVVPPSAVESLRDPPSETSQQPQKQTGRRVVNIPLPGDAWAVLQAPYPMTDEEWAQMLAVLAAMKPGWVRNPTNNVET